MNWVSLSMLCALPDFRSALVGIKQNVTQRQYHTAVGLLGIERGELLLKIGILLLGLCRPALSQRRSAGVHPELPHWHCQLALLSCALAF